MLMQLSNYLKRQGVDFHTNNPDIKGAAIELFTRTLKTKMYKYFTRNDTYRYLDVVNDITSYNSVHFTITMAPSTVSSSNILYGKM